MHTVERVGRNRLDLRLGWSPAVALALCASAIGCGAASEGDGTRPPAGSPTARFASAIAALTTAETKDECATVAAYTDAVSFYFECPLPADSRRWLSSLRPEDEATYGTGAVVDLEGAPGFSGTAILFRTPDRDWGVRRLANPSPPTVGTGSPRMRQRFDQAAATFVRTVRSGACKSLKAYLSVGSPTAGPGDGITCGSHLRDYEPLATALRTAPETTARYLGGNRFIGVYGVDVDTPTRRYWTVVVQSSPATSTQSLVLYAMPGPAAAM